MAIIAINILFDKYNAAFGDSIIFITKVITKVKDSFFFWGGGYELIIITGQNKGNINGI